MALDEADVTNDEGAGAATASNRACTTNITQSSQGAIVEVTFFDAVVNDRSAKPEPWVGAWHELLPYLQSKATNAQLKGASGYWVAAPCASFHSNANCSPTRVVALDWDDPGPPDWGSLDGLAYVAHTTDSHAEGTPRWRVWLPLNRGYSAPEVGSAKCPWHGAKLRSISQPAYVPTRGSAVEWRSDDGAPLNLDGWRAPPPEAASIALAPEHGEPPFTRESARALLGDPSETNYKCGGLGRLLWSEAGFSPDEAAAYVEGLLTEVGHPSPARHVDSARRACAPNSRAWGWPELSKRGFEARSVTSDLDEEFWHVTGSEYQRGQRGAVFGNSFNVDLFVRTTYYRRLRFNELTHRVELDGATVDLDALAAQVKVDFCAVHRADPKKEVIRDALQSTARRATYSPVLAYLDRLQWDGVPRIDGWLQTYCGAKDAPEYLRAIGRKWLIGAVARAYEPGCQMDSMLVLEGPQGGGKSTVAQTLGLGADRFHRAIKLEGNKDDNQKLDGVWIAEWGELAGQGYSDVEYVKAFISDRHPNFRRTYRADTAPESRRCVFVGTTNAVTSGLLTSFTNRGNSVKFTGERWFFTGEEGVFTGEGEGQCFLLRRCLARAALSSLASLRR